MMNPYLTLHSTTEVLSRIKTALISGRSLSLIRLGNGEALSLAHDVLVPLQRIPAWLEYAGVTLPDETVRRSLLKAVREADIVGLTTDTLNWDCAPLLQQIVNFYQPPIKYPTDAAVNWALHQYNRLYQIIDQVSTILVGRLAATAAPILRKKGLRIVNTVSLDCFADLVTAENACAAGPRFRVALVAAGIPATILCPRLAQTHGCIAIDYGHVINDLIKPGFSNKDLPAETERWFQQRQSRPN